MCVIFIHVLPEFVSEWLPLALAEIYSAVFENNVICSLFILYIYCDLIALQISITTLFHSILTILIDRELVIDYCIMF